MFSVLAAVAISQMSLNEKIGQLFIIPAVPDHGQRHEELILNLIREYHIGGVLLQKGAPESARSLLSKIKNQPIPLLCFGDAEWGVSMRMRDTIRFPRNLTLGAIQDPPSLVEFGRQVGWECAQVGININFAPVADVNTNSRNPVIGTRSFGSDPGAVTLKAFLVAQGMLSEGIWPCAKHFPGHGNTFVDSHLDLPSVETLELLPFKELVAKGIPAIMTAHLYCEPLGEIATFSRSLIQDTLRDAWQFNGLIITDALNMKALTKAFSPEEIAVSALKAGHDCLLFGSHLIEVVEELLVDFIPRAYAAVQQAVSCGEISEAEIDAHVVRILRAKEDLCRPLPPPQDLRTPQAISLKRSLLRQAITLYSNSLLPLAEKTPFTVAQFGAGEKALAASLARYGTIGEGVVIVAIYEATTEAVEFLRHLQKRGIPYVVVLFCSPYRLLELKIHPTTLIAYEDDPDAEEAAADVIFGKLEPKGILPVFLEN